MTNDAPQTMTYPPPPWALKGYGLQTLHLLHVEQVQAVLPPELKIVQVLPGLTVGMIYAAAYSSASTMPYNELIVMSAIASYQGTIGAWISHIYVDNPNSVQGGREIWGLPKEMAEFTWQMGKSPGVTVSQGDRILCSLTCKWYLPALPGFQLPVGAPVLGQVNSRFLTFPGQGNLGLHLASIDVQIPPESPFAPLNAGLPWMSFYSDPLVFTAGVPSFI
jgi:acetoacetate decarboxylase